jgi:sirohydrochlorin ferrochelatase
MFALKLAPFFLHECDGVRWSWTWNREQNRERTGSRKTRTALKRSEAQRRAAKMPPSPEELELDSKIRRWPRTPETDPYQSGLEAVATQLRANLGEVLLAVAYNEFCAPTLEESVEELIKKGATLTLP